MKNLLARSQSSNGLLFCLMVAAISFSTYSCMYAFRKPIAVGLFADLSYWGIPLKVLYLSAQIFGYAISKFVGIKVVSEFAGKNRALAILILIGLAAFSLLLFALVPPPWNIVFMFLNGIPLGMVWGLVFSYLEGRRVTEALAAGLCTSFILASGVVKSVGAYIMITWGISEFWMPFVTGLVFVPPLLISAYLLEQIPQPDTADIEARTGRLPMSGKQRWEFFRKYAPGLTLLVASYLLLTVVRDLRDNFSADIWATLGYAESPEIFTLTELPIAIVVLVMIALMVLIKNNRRALALSHLLILIGVLLAGGVTLLLQAEIIGPEMWMIGSGLGLYMAYVPFNSVLFDRMIATFKEVANVGFLIYLADSFGYLGSVGVMLYKNFGQPQLDWFLFMQYTNLFLACFGGLAVAGSWIYFSSKSRRKRSSQSPITLAGARAQT